MPKLLNIPDIAIIAGSTIAVVLLFNKAMSYFGQPTYEA